MVKRGDDNTRPLLLVRASWITLLLVFSLVPARAQAVPVPQQLRACGDGDGFPPYTFADTKHPAGEATGYHVEMLRAVLASSQRQVHIDLLPWARSVALATQGRYDIILDISRTPVRGRDFLTPRHSYRLSSIAVYRRDRSPPILNTVQDLIPLRRCEVLGWDYSAAGLPADTPATGQPGTLEAAARMLRAGRCEVLLYDLELLGGAIWQGRPDPLPASEFAYVRMAWISQVLLYFGVSRALPYRDELTALLDAGLARFQASDESRRLRQAYKLP